MEVRLRQCPLCHLAEIRMRLAERPLALNKEDPV
jgi:hypothetical protein